MKNIKTKRIISLILAFAFMFTITPPSIAMAQDSNPSVVEAFKAQVGEGVSENDKLSIIVQLKDKTPLTAETAQSASGKFNKMQTSAKIQDSLMNKIDRKDINIKVGHKYTLLLNGFSGQTTYAEALKIASMPEVKSVDIDTLYLPVEPVDEVKMTTSVDIIKAREAWDLNFKGEGKLVSIIDSGADITHKDWVITDMTKAKYQNEAALKDVVTKNSLPGKWQNNKIVYGYNYQDQNNILLDETAKTGMHGMHVAGTVAANGNVAEGGIKGVAPEAQLLVLRVFGTNGAGAYASTYAKAIEDSVILGADAVNMSLGSPAGSIHHIIDAVTTAIKNAMNIGCVVAIAGGNEGYFGEQVGLPKADAPDYGLVGTPSVAPDSLAVASINNTHVKQSFAILADGTKFGFKLSGSNPLIYNKPIELVNCNYGLEADFADKNLTGKFALIERGNANFKDMATRAAAKNADGIVVYNKPDGGEELVAMGVDGATIPAVSIPRSIGLKLVQKLQTITFSDKLESVPSTLEGTMSDFSNWGVSNEQDVKPEITAPGGNIYSTLNNNSYGTMSGTSMATPHVAGGIAVVNERVTKDFKSITGSEKYSLIKNLLMSTATPATDKVTKTMISPRKQGSGVMNLKAATTSNVIVVDPTTNVSKIVKKDLSGTNFELKMTLINKGNTDVTYNYETSVQTDLVAEKIFALRPRLLNTIKGDKPVTVKANSSAEVIVNVDFSAKDAELKKEMPNGYFVEGFVTFTSDNHVSLSMPYVGFKGVWSELEVLEKSVYELVEKGEKPFYYGKFPEGKNPNTKLYEFTHLYSSVNGQMTPLGYYPDEQKIWNKDKIVISPNGDGNADRLDLVQTFLRNYIQTYLEVVDPVSNKSVFKSDVIDLNSKAGRKTHFSGQYAKSLRSTDWNWKGQSGSNLSYTKVPDGEYKLYVKTRPMIVNAKEQSTSYKILVDTKAPTVKDLVYDKTTGKLTFNATDATSGVKKLVVMVKGGQAIKPETDGSYKIPVGTLPENIIVTVEDYGYNSISDNIVNIANPAINGAIIVKGITSDMSPVPTFKAVVTDSKGVVQTNLARLPYGKYKVEATEVPANYNCLNKVQEVELTEANPKVTVTFKFSEIKIPTGEITVILKTIGGTYDNLELVATDSKGKEYTLAPAKYTPSWYVVKVPYENYKLSVKNLKTGWIFSPQNLEIKVDKEYPELLHAVLSYGNGGEIKPVATTPDGVDVSKVKFGVVDEYGNAIDISKKLVPGDYTVYPIDLPAGTYVTPQYKNITLANDKVEKPEFVVKKANGALGSIKITTIKAKDTYTDLNPTYEVEDFYGKKVTDLTKVVPGTYYIKPIKPLEYTADPENAEVIITPENLHHEVKFTFTKWSDTGKNGKLSIFVSFKDGYDYRKDIKIQIIDEKGKVTEIVKKRFDTTNAMELPFGVYNLKVVDLDPGYYADPQPLTVLVNSDFAFATLNIKEGTPPPPADDKVVTIEKPQDIKVPFGTPADKLPLPKTVKGTLSNKKVVNLPVNWDVKSYNPNEAKTYTLKGEIGLSEVPAANDGKLAIVNPDKLVAEINVTVNPIEKVDVEGNITWKDDDNQDGLRPTEVIVNLMKNGVKVDSKKVTEADGWSYSFQGLVKAENDKDIVYTVEQEPIKGYETKVLGLNILNTHVSDLISVNGLVNWDDNNNQDGVRPTEVIVNLMKNGIKVEEKKVTEADGWKFEFVNLDKKKDGKDVTYTVTQKEIDSYETKVDGLTITNTHKTAVTSVNGMVMWKDNNNQDGNRPTEVTINLLKNGVKVDSLKVNSENYWKYSFKDLPKMDGGKVVAYTVMEEEVSGYQININGYNITNVLIPKVTEVAGTIKFEDDNNADKLRPTEVVVNLLKNGAKVNSVTVKEENAWKYIFEDLQAFENGKEVTYTVSVEPFKGYAVSISGYDILFTRMRETITFDGKIVWDDNDNAKHVRPEGVLVELYKNNTLIGTKFVTEKENWMYSFNMLAKTENGEEIVYTVKATEVKGYTSVVEGSTIKMTIVPTTPDAPKPNPEKDTTKPAPTPGKEVTKPAPTPGNNNPKPAPSKGSALPATGETTSAIPIAVGGFILVAALVVLVSAKKKSSK